MRTYSGGRRMSLNRPPASR